MSAPDLILRSLALDAALNTAYTLHWTETYDPHGWFNSANDFRVDLPTTKLHVVHVNWRCIDATAMPANRTVILNLMIAGVTERPLLEVAAATPDPADAGFVVITPDDYVGFAFKVAGSSGSEALDHAFELVVFSQP